MLHKPLLTASHPQHARYTWENDVLLRKGRVTSWN